MPPAGAKRHRDIVEITEALLEASIPESKITDFIEGIRLIELFITDFIDIHGKHDVNSHDTTTYGVFRIKRIDCTLTIFNHGLYALTCIPFEYDLAFFGTLKLIPNTGWKWQVKDEV